MCHRSVAPCGACPPVGALNCVWQIVGSRGTREGSGNSGHRAGGRQWRLAVIMCLDRASCLSCSNCVSLRFPSSFALPPPPPRPQGFRGAVRTCDVGSLVEWHCEVGRWGGGFLAVCRAAQQELKVTSLKVAADGRDAACQAPPPPHRCSFPPTSTSSLDRNDAARIFKFVRFFSSTWSIRHLPLPSPPLPLAPHPLPLFSFFCSPHLPHPPVRTPPLFLSSLSSGVLWEEGPCA